jgi:hypothetical protein
MSEPESPRDADPHPEDADIRALWERVAAAMREIDEAKRERSAEQIRAARTQLAALHSVARLRRHAERDLSAA